MATQRTLAQRVSDQLRQSRLLDFHNNLHRQVQDWVSANGKTAFQVYLDAARTFRIRNGLKSHHAIPYNPDECIAAVMLFHQHAFANSTILQQLWDFIKNDIKAKAYFKHLSAHSFTFRLYEISHFKSWREQGLTAKDATGIFVFGDDGSPTQNGSGGIEIMETEFSNFAGLDGRGWACDVCGEPIMRARDGWVEWLRVFGEENARNPREYGLRLVHHLPASPRKEDVETGCQYDGRMERKQNKAGIKDLGLIYFVGPDGLMRLLALIAEKELPQKEVLEMTKRLHVPGYEFARHHLEAARSVGVYEPNTIQGYPHQSQIEEVRNWAEREDR